MGSSRWWLLRRVPGKAGGGHQGMPRPGPLSAATDYHSPRGPSTGDNTPPRSLTKPWIDSSLCSRKTRLPPAPWAPLQFACPTFFARFPQCCEGRVLCPFSNGQLRILGARSPAEGHRTRLSESLHLNPSPFQGQGHSHHTAIQSTITQDGHPPSDGW